MQFDHVAIAATDIPATVEWYRRHLSAGVLFQQQTWALLEVGGAKLALVTPGQHPPHLALRVGEDELAAAVQRWGLPIVTHRDGTRGIYIEDPAGNSVELICYPAGSAAYDAPAGGGGN